MALNCSACEELRENAPDFVVNELTDRMCTSLKNNTGLNPSNSNTNCDDLHDANDCLVGRMAQDVEAYEVCDWKEYMKKFVTNLYNLLKAIICWLCGIQASLDKAWCWLENLTVKQKTHRLYAYDEQGNPINGFRIADGVEMRTGTYDSPIRVVTRGSDGYTSGSLRFYGNMPSTYTNGAEVPWNYLQHGCASLTNKDGDSWGANGTNAGVLIWEIQFKKCQLGFTRPFGYMKLFPAAGGDFQFNAYLFQKGDLIAPDWTIDPFISGTETPRPDSYIFNPDDDDMLLMQVRLIQTRLPLGSITPQGNFAIVPCEESLDCD